MIIFNDQVIQDQIKLFTFRAGIFLTVISAALYSSIWLLIDNEILKTYLALSDVITDFVFCVAYSAISLVVSHYVFKGLGCYPGVRWGFVYCIILAVINGLIAVVMNETSDFALASIGYTLFDIREMYTYAILVTVVSGIYIIMVFKSNSHLIRRGKQLTKISTFGEEDMTQNIYSTLNGIVESEAETSSIFLSHLSKVYRHIVQNISVDLIDLCEELDFIDSYIYLMKLRHGDGIFVNIDNALRTFNHRIPPASLQLLMENAIKCNMFSPERPLMIEILYSDGHIVVSNSKLPTVGDAVSADISHANIISRYSSLSTKAIRINDTEYYYSVSLPLL